MISILNTIIEGAGAALTGLLSILPDSPFSFTQNINSGWLKAICWIFPIQEAIVHITTFVTAAALYYGIRILMRWLKMVGA